MAPHVRWKLQAVVQELRDIQSRVRLIGDEFLEYLVATAADQAEDDLRDDLLLRQEHDERVRATSDTGATLHIV